MSDSSAPLPDFFDWAWKHKLLMLPIVLALVLSICSGFVGLIYISAMTGVRDHPLHRQSVELASENPLVSADLGQPMTGGFISEGTIDVDDDNQFGSADVTIPISGPLGRGRLLTKARLVDGKWTIDQLTASLESGKVIRVVEQKAE